jgi:hypothetical protein
VILLKRSFECRVTRRALVIGTELVSPPRPPWMYENGATVVSRASGISLSMVYS